jgi:hypothetical protein
MKAGGRRVASVVAAAEATRLEELDASVALLTRALGASGSLLHRFDERGAPQGVVLAARLHVSIETVRTNVQRTLGELGVASRVEAAARLRAYGQPSSVRER